MVRCDGQAGNISCHNISKMAIDPKTQQALIAAGVVLVIVILIMCVFTPWNRMGVTPVAKNQVDPVQTKAVANNDANSDEVTGATGEDNNLHESEENPKAMERSNLHAEQSKHRAALLMRHPGNRRLLPSPTTSAVMLAAMRSPSRSRTAASATDYDGDDYDINDIEPAMLSGK